jgi:RNA 2',3'-cyclic 3'-phosphodiesterase
MRLFIAVELPPPVLLAAAHVSRLLQQRVLDLAPKARLTWVPIDRMHLTIRFLGEVDSARLGALESTFAAPFETPAFALSLGGAGAFPSRGAPRVLWLGVEHGLADLQRLEREVSGRLEVAGFPPDRRAFNPHLTLARVRTPQGLGLPALLDGVDPPDGSGSVDAITLFESRLSPTDRTYTPLRRTSLRPA